tara:strand:+ start:1366 stop:1782 length:417 start_codon:yes stop_codon:yes gene_type:complete
MADDGERAARSGGMEGGVRGYSPLVLSHWNEMAHVSGQVGCNEDNEVPPTFRDQVFLAFANLERVLASADYGLRDVVKLCTYLVDRNDVLAFQEARAEVLLASHDGLAPLPASTLVVVSSLADPSWRVEIDAVAVRRR